MRIVNQISIQELQEMSGHFFEDMVKAVVDVEECNMAVDAELHADLESILLKNGSMQENLWGINIYPFFQENDFIEFDSIINIRPYQNNRSRGVENVDIQSNIINIVKKILNNAT